MKQRRLAWLLATMGALVLVRWLVPPQAPVEEAASQAVARPAKPASAVPPVVVAVASAASSVVPRIADTTDIDLPGNAFAVRPPPAPPPAPPPPPPPPSAKTAFVGPPAPPPPAPPPPPPPFQVIGTWDDGSTPGVFVATPNGTQLARKGTVLMAEYRVTAITPQQLLLEQISSKREFRFNVPRPAGK